MTLDQLSRDVEQTFGQFQARKQAADTLRLEVETLESSTALLGLTEAALSTLLAEVSQENLRQIEGLISYGLRTVFDDLPLTFKFVQSQQRGGPSLEPTLVLGDVEQPILDSFGGGPATVVAFLLRVIVCHRFGLYPLVLLDETFSMVSRQYVPNVAKLLKELAAQLQVTFILVTHQGEFLDHADRAYRIVDTATGATFIQTGAADG